jgi:copper chaperone CopZ
MSSTITTTLPINGMTCGHCIQAVTSELTQLEGVHDVAVELVPDGTSRVTVTSAQPLDDATVRAAIDEAGYALAR